jgi:zinc D-Ala-D-Ala carboxypeptidase
MKLSHHFTLAEMTVTTTGIPNEPASVAIVENLRKVCANILEPVHKKFGRAIVIHSGYRSPAVNKAVKGSAASQHCKGEAADFHVSGVTVMEVAQWLSASDIDYDQLILENYVPGQASSGWVHCSFSALNRNMELTKFKGSSTYYPGILQTPP